MNGGGGGDPPRVVAGQPTPYWDNLSERRLDYITGRLGELAAQLADAVKEIRVQIRVSDQQAGSLQQHEDRLRDVKRELEDLGKRLEKYASAEWLSRLETRVTNIEDESKSPFVRKTEFDPVKKVTFGIVSTLCLGVLAAVAKLIMK